MITYFFSVLICWAACLALYAGLLQKEKFFHLNRAYLLLTLVLGLLIPAVNWFPAAATPMAGLIPATRWLPELTITNAPVLTDPGTTGLTLGQALLGLYLLGCTWMTFRFFRQLYRVAVLVNSGEKTRLPEYTLVESNRVSTPFSFLGFLFRNPDQDYEPAEWQAVRNHEYAHIRQGHSLDLLLLEIIGIFCWWCPLWYGYNRALRNVHEYLADEAVIRQLPTRDYGQLLIRQCLSQPAPALAHGLRHHSQLKNRIAMMTKISSSRMALAKYFALLPLLGFLTVACSQTEPVEMTQAQAEKYKPTGQVIDTVTTYDPDTYNETTEYITSDLYQEVEQMPVFGSCPDLKGEELEKCSLNNLMQFLISNMKYPEEAKKAKVEGMVVANFVIFTSGQVGNVQIKKSVSPECDAEVVRLIKMMPNWSPGYHDGKAVNVEFSLPVKFRLN